MKTHVCVGDDRWVEIPMDMAIKRLNDEMEANRVTARIMAVLMVIMSILAILGIFL